MRPSSLISGLTSPMIAGLAASATVHVVAIWVMMGVDLPGASWATDGTTARSPVLVRLTPPSNPTAVPNTLANIDALAVVPPTERQRPVIESASLLARSLTTRTTSAPIETTTAAPSIDIADAAETQQTVRPSTAPPPPDAPDLLTGIHTSADPLPEAPPSPPASANTGPRIPAELVFAPEPAYPARSIRRGHQGESLIAIDVRADGTIARVRLDESSGYRALDEAALAAARRCRFNPATRNGRPIASTVLVPFEFNLQG